MALKLDTLSKFNDFIKLTNTAGKHLHPRDMRGIRPLLAHIRSNHNIARSQYDSSKFNFAESEYGITSKCGVLYIRSGNYLAHMNHYIQAEFETTVNELFTKKPEDSPRVKAEKAAEKARLMAEEEAKKKAFEAASRRAEQERRAQAKRTYDKVFAKYYNSGSKPVYRIEYYYPFDPMAINGEPNQKRYEIETDSGVLFFRNNVLVSYMPGFNFDNFRDNIYDFEFNSARAMVPMSIIFFYNHNVLYYFRTADVSELATRLHLVLNMGVLFFRNGRLLEYMDDYDKAEFQRIIKLPLTHEFMKEPVTEEMKEIKRLRKVSNNNNNAYQQRAENMEEMITVQQSGEGKAAQANAGLTVSIQNSANHDITYHADGSITINPKKDKPAPNTNTSTDVNNMDGCCIVL
ncbi:hypothetical protein BX661DRAFT_223601 [Kickxella alabastrina]|uniref:uncharacterized protein n=1 Tax=Kickxella alabastrina TaxID=61397 RepID=UPI00221F19A5|nr:uncharacterized protein BX661DRAFT_223601 [Kickxella alabastrina]KAI7830783.1 hypothetical protein BX661DRAFT_223601 [Kickxella alabastrina]